MENKKIQDLLSVMDAVDKAFAPDIRVVVEGDESMIIGIEAITTAGASFLLHNSIFGESYDYVSFPDLCTEVIFKDDFDNIK